MATMIVYTNVYYLVKNEANTVSPWQSFRSEGFEECCFEVMHPRK